jgi:hypothetical protein
MAGIGCYQCGEKIDGDVVIKTFRIDNKGIKTGKFHKECWIKFFFENRYRISVRREKSVYVKKA